MFRYGESACCHFAAIVKMLHIDVHSLFKRNFQFQHRMQRKRATFKCISSQTQIFEDSMVVFKLLANLARDGECAT